MSTVIYGTLIVFVSVPSTFAEGPYEPAVAPDVASAIVPVVVISPPVSPVPAVTFVTVPVLDVLLFQVYFSPVVQRDTSVPPLAADLEE